MLNALVTRVQEKTMKELLASLLLRLQCPYLPVTKNSLNKVLSVSGNRLPQIMKKRITMQSMPSRSSMNLRKKSLSSWIRTAEPRPLKKYNKRLKIHQTLMLHKSDKKRVILMSYLILQMMKTN
jgi:hypothetical protein